MKLRIHMPLGPSVDMDIPPGTTVDQAVDIARIRQWIKPHKKYVCKINDVLAERNTVIPEGATRVVITPKAHVPISLGPTKNPQHATMDELIKMRARVIRKKKIPKEDHQRVTQWLAELEAEIKNRQQSQD